MRTMIKEYRQALKRLYERRERLCGQMQDVGQRLKVLNEEIDEMEETLMYMREYVRV